MFLPRDATQSAVLLRQSRPSVCLSVTLRYRDHVGWKCSKILSRLVSLACLLFADPNIRDVIQREHPKNLTRNDPSPEELSLADIRWQIMAERPEIAQWSQWRAYRKPPLSNGMIDDPYDLPFSPNCGPKCTDQEQISDVCCHLANTMEDIDKIWALF